MDGVLITDDLFDVASRLKSVNCNYKLYFNKKTQKYEVRETKGLNETLAFVVPYDELDARTVEYARFTAIQNAKALFAEIERHNAALDRENERRLSEKISKKAEELK